MTSPIVALNHVCLVVTDEAASKAFFKSTLGLKEHKTVSSWLYLTDTILLHLVEIPDAQRNESLYHEVQHFAVEVERLPEVLAILIDTGVKPFQMNFEGKEHHVASKT